MKQFSIVLIVLMVSIPVFGAEPIDGAFGLKLGATLDVDGDGVEVVGGFEDAVYRVEPPTPLSGFQDYLVFVTPISHTIYQIKAFRYFGLKKQAEKEYSFLEKILDKKY